MWYGNLYLVLGCILQVHSSSAIWQCAGDGDCASLSGSVCAAGTCACPITQQIVAGGTLCADYAPYYTSPCIDDFQCSRLFTAFECRRDETQTGNCFCQPGNHYYRGRCWRSTELGESCSRDEECMGVIRDPHGMSCVAQTCQCSEGYYSRQRGECRRIGAAVGDRCVLDEDCQFTNGVCDPLEFICNDANNPTAHTVVMTAQNTTSTSQTKMAARQDGAACSTASSCVSPFECSSWGQCVCPLGYYGSGDGTACLAELDSPSTEAQCVGLLAEVQAGVCTCPANFFYDENMRDCVKVVRGNTDFCFTDAQCHTLGASSFCGAPDQWGLRTCECDLELTVWDAQRSMCRLFAGIGEACQVDSDCMAGELEIQCALDDAGEGYCACPDGLFAQDSLCLNTGLELGDACQVTQECTATPNTVCEAGRCSCDNGYQELNDVCAPIIGGTCSVDADCVISDTTCAAGDDGLTCQCREDFVEYSDECWQIGYNASCTVDAQCASTLGSSASCQDGSCLCGANFHYKDSACWPITGLFESCSRSSECYLGDITERVVCRNSLCQCSFDYPYSEELHTCRSSASSLSTGIFLIFTTLAYIFIK